MVLIIFPLPSVQLQSLHTPFLPGKASQDLEGGDKRHGRKASGAGLSLDH